MKKINSSQPAGHRPHDLRPTATPFELIRTQSTFQITSQNMDLSGAREAAAQLDGRLAPALLDHFSGPPAQAGCRLLLTPEPSAFQTWPNALFRLEPELGVAEIPAEWVQPYLQWAERLRRSQQLNRWVTNSGPRATDAPGLAAGDAILAGLRLFLFSPEPGSVHRRQLLEAALAQPMGGYLCAEALHTTTERQAIAESLAGDSLAVLGASHVAGFAASCLRQARSRQDLASGLVVARLGTGAELAAWLRQAGLTAFADSAAASAMLVLSPKAPPKIQAAWLGALQHPGAGPDAYATVRWARHTWPATAWGGLKTALKSSVIQDGGRLWYNWFAHLDRAKAATGLEMPADPLWSFELVHALDLEAGTLRIRLAAELARRTHHQPSSLILEALNVLHQIGANYTNGNR